MHRIKSSKKAQGLPWETIIIAAILIIVMVVIIVMFTDLFGKQRTQISGQIDSLGDNDGDQIINMYDSCPCISGESDYSGCPNQASLEEAKKQPKPTKC